MRIIIDVSPVYSRYDRNPLILISNIFSHYSSPQLVNGHARMASPDSPSSSKSKNVQKDKVCPKKINKVRHGKTLLNLVVIGKLISTIYNMSGCVVSDIQTRAEGESLYIRHNTDANVVNGLKNDSSYEFIGKVILKINVV